MLAADGLLAQLAEPQPSQQPAWQPLAEQVQLTQEQVGPQQQSAAFARDGVEPANAKLERPRSAAAEAARRDFFMVQIL